MSTLKTRFAPSPTGLMHFGNLRTALFNLLYAKHFQGVFLLRIEDTDMARSEERFQDSIMADLKWMGIEWQDGPYFQSERQAIYEQYYEALQKEGRIYPCFCTEEQLAITRKVQLSLGQPPRYPGTCRRLSAQEVAEKKKAGIPHTLRFLVPTGKTVEFEDLIKGDQRFETDHIGDFIIRRGDASASFMFCNAIDDALMGVTHALRGDDHLTNTPRQILIQEALKLSVPRYGHFPTILGPDSRPLSKRNGSRSIQELREEGYQPLAILNYLARLGHYDADPKLLSLESLSAHFDLANISLSPAHYDAQQLNFWQKEVMHALPWENCWNICAEHLPEDIKALIPKEKKQLFIETIQPNLVMPLDAKHWVNVIFRSELSFNEHIDLIIKKAGKEFFLCALNLLNAPGVSYTTLVPRLQEKTGRKGKELFAPLRAALTAEVHGPELAKILELMGTEKARHRLERAATYASDL